MQTKTDAVNQLLGTTMNNKTLAYLIFIAALVFTGLMIWVSQ